jgi:hypothetical protein
VGRGHGPAADPHGGGEKRAGSRMRAGDPHRGEGRSRMTMMTGPPQPLLDFLCGCSRASLCCAEIPLCVG